MRGVVGVVGFPEHFFRYACIENFWGNATTPTTPAERDRMNTKAKASANEYWSRKLLEAVGYFVIRAGASLGVFDLIAVGRHDVIGVQVKTGRLPETSAAPVSLDEVQSGARHRWFRMVDRDVCERCDMPPIALALVALLLLAGAFSVPDYGYYTFLRLVVCASCAYEGCVGLGSDKKSTWPWAALGVALLFNPVIPVHLKKGTWVCIDVGVAATRICPTRTQAGLF